MHGGVTDPGGSPLTAATSRSGSIVSHTPSVTTAAGRRERHTLLLPDASLVVSVDWGQRLDGLDNQCPWVAIFGALTAEQRAVQAARGVCSASDLRRLGRALMLDPTSLAFIAMAAYVLHQQAEGDHLVPIGDRARVLDLDGARTVMEWHARSAGGRIHGSPLEVIAAAFCLGIDISIYRQRELRGRVLDQLGLCFTARGFVPQPQVLLGAQPTINVLHREPHFTALSPHRPGDPLLMAVSRAWFHCHDITCFGGIHALFSHSLACCLSSRPFTICDPIPSLCIDLQPFQPTRGSGSAGGASAGVPWLPEDAVST